MDNLCMNDLDFLYADDLSIPCSSFDDDAILITDTENQQIDDDLGKVGDLEAAADFDKDWAASAGITTISANMSSQPSDEQQQEPAGAGGTGGHRHASVLEEMIFKLNKTMLKSARTRAMITKTVYPDLKRKGYELKGQRKKGLLVCATSTTTASAHKAKHAFSKKHCRDSFSAEVSPDNSICRFLRASKRW